LATFKPKDAQELWQKLIEFDRKAQALKKDQTGTDESYELCSPQHAFRKVENAAYDAGVHDAQAPEKYVAAYMKSAEALMKKDVKITHDQQSEIIGWARKHLVHQTHHEDFDGHNFKRHSTLSKLRQELIEVVTFFSDPQSHGKYVRRLDSYLHQNKVPADLLDAMQKVAVAFADSNWNQDGHSINFCFYPDLVAKQVRLGMIYDDGTHLAPMNQDEWVNNQEWTISKTEIDVKA
jgi:hypothetical protein